MITRPLRLAAAVTSLLLGTGAAQAAGYGQTMHMFKNANQSAGFFKKSYGYAIFPTVASGSFIVGAAHGDGRVYERGVLVGNTAVTQVSVGWQAGGEGYSEIIFSKTSELLTPSNRATFNLVPG